MCDKEEIGLFYEDGTPLKKEDLPIPGASIDMNVCAAAIQMLREAKDKHLPMMITNADNTRALLIKDANDLKCKITVNGIPFEEI